MFLVESHLVRESESDPSSLAEALPMENKNMLWRWVAKSCSVSHYEREKRDFDVCIKQKSAYNRTYVNSSVFYFFYLRNLDNLYNEPACLTSRI